MIYFKVCTKLLDGVLSDKRFCLPKILFKKCKIPSSVGLFPKIFELNYLKCIILWYTTIILVLSAHTLKLSYLKRNIVIFCIPIHHSHGFLLELRNRESAKKYVKNLKVSKTIKKLKLTWNCFQQKLIPWCWYSGETSKILYLSPIDLKSFLDQPLHLWLAFYQKPLIQKWGYLSKNDVSSIEPAYFLGLW